jgi:hypothetical protein
MKNNLLSRTLSGVALIALAAFALPVLPAWAANDADIVKQVQSAKTAADHEAIARYYDTEAADATKSAAVHRKMAETYSAGPSIGKGMGPVPFPQHCQALAKDADDEASHYTAMAETHRELAKAAK